ncbi:MAG: aminopeptidase P N-terminal domain-containing protein [Kiritimatiellia bacterium]|nr:aminopeptidase P N-terminal domain-containing protein [Kiritimatiellia bacterium]MDP6811471.1 aminopeptidase P N-terminal domain-containing protein [Kiritimatiellia bacterium]
MKAEFHRSRREQFYRNMSDHDALVLFAGSAPRKTADASYRFFANRNFYYMTGILQKESVLLAVKRDGDVEETLFVLPKDPMAERWQGRRLAADEASALSGIEAVKDLAAFEQAVKGAINSGQIDTVWYDFDPFDVGRKDAPHNRHCETVRADYPAIAFKNAYLPISRARAIKAPDEIDAIREAMCITRDGIHAMMKAAKPGMYEYQLEAVFNKVLADAGVREPAFESIISSGRNNFCIHYDEPMDILNDGDLILVDVGARKNGYSNDISRAFPVNGLFSEEQKTVYSIALKISKDLMAMLVPHKVTFADIEDLCRRRMAEELVSAGYLSEDEDVSKYRWHNGTHHVGLDVHDVGAQPVPIEPGMVFTIDVGIYIEEKNIGFRVEDDVVVTATGYEHLSSDIVREIDDIEAMMR